MGMRKWLLEGFLFRRKKIKGDDEKIWTVKERDSKGYVGRSAGFILSAFYSHILDFLI